jgi:hypothetical protein
MNFLTGKIRRVSVVRMIFSVLVIAGIVFALASNARYFRNYFKGPYAISQAELAGAPDAESLPRYWVMLKADEVAASGFQEITIHKKHGVERSREVSANYFVAFVGDRLLLVKAHQDTPTASLKGYLKPITGQVDRAFFDDPEAKKVQARFYPMLLDTEDFKTDGQIGLTVAGVLGLGALFFGFVAFRRFRDPSTHPLMQRVATWGDVDKIARQLEKEAGDKNALKFGGYLFTASCVMRNEMSSFDVQRMDEILWAYKHILQKKLYYIIPAGKTYSVSLNWQNVTWQISGKEEKVDAVLRTLEERFPWVLCGYSDELATAYKKNREEVVQVVASRRQEVEARAVA